MNQQRFYKHLSCLVRDLYNNHVKQATGKIKLFTIGHSTRAMEEFLSLLNEFKIKVLIDIRRFPGSHKFPHFSLESLEKTLPQAGIDYVWLENLGGRRSGPEIGKSLNLGLKIADFRNYADYMQTQQFHQAVEQLLTIASAKPAVIMCAEKLFWKCHRRLLSDFLVAQGVIVEHIMDSGRLQQHKISPDAIITSGLNVIYPAGSGTSKTLFDL
jgi:uncharacterized protein (DUF488 family)